ncbi:hypothetical protein Tco_0048757, partial [Tanacetum coccineum]
MNSNINDGVSSLVVCYSGVVSNCSRSGFTCGGGFNDGSRSGLTGVVVVALWRWWVTVV